MTLYCSFLLVCLK
nr:unnamed protein product [Callosobruchus analis]